MVDNFSVLLSVCCRDSSSFFDEAMLSISVNQTLKPSQIVLVKDGDVSDELDSVIEFWQSKLGNTLKLVEFPLNKGLGAALESGLKACDHDLVARMDADDISLRNRFKKQVTYLSYNSEVDILGAEVQEIDSFGVALGRRSVPIQHESIILKLWACPLIHPTVMFRRSRILKAGNYSPNLPRRQDYELWFRCAEHGLRFHNLPEVLLHYRFGEHTHKKQSPKIAWQQGVIGFNGSGKIGTPLRFRLLCFVPLVRSLLPRRLQHFAYKALGRFDPRKKVQS
jgi:glycosyltransferase involved in cell wall biosynthesis